jgi:hypothetical protein
MTFFQAWAPRTVRIGHEKHLGWSSRPVDHDMPRHDDRAYGLVRFLPYNLLQARDAFRLVLEQRVVRWYTNVMRPFGAGLLRQMIWPPAMRRTQTLLLSRDWPDLDTRVLRQTFD